MAPEAAPQPAPHATPFAGSWYPDRPDELAALLDRVFDSSLERTPPTLLPRPLAFIVPHAGLAYSGTVAAAVYRYLRASPPARVFLLGFNHRGGPPGVSVPDISGFETPVGPVPIDRAATPFPAIPEDQLCDHSVEIQLPLLRRAIPDVPIVPLYVGSLTDAGRSSAADILAHSLRPGDVLLASSDFTHYGRSFGYLPFPSGQGFHHRLLQLDSQIIEAAGSLDPAFFRLTLEARSSTVCGRDPIALLFETLRLMAGDDVFQQPLDYQTSAEITGDTRHSVSYASLAYFRSDSFFLDAEDGRALLAGARATLDHLHRTGERLPIPPAPSPAFDRCASVFVSLHQGPYLFGCIGTRGASAPLSQTVPELTLSAALEDPRFAHRSIPGDLEIELSILTPMRRIRDWKSFQIGRDGACMEYGSRTELLLPQVATHGANTAPRFLEALSQKGGLHPGAYRDPQARLSVFRAQILK